MLKNLYQIIKKYFFYKGLLDEILMKFHKNTHKNVHINNLGLKFDINLTLFINISFNICNFQIKLVLI